MPRIARVDVGGYVYHVINRANARVQIFNTPEDYSAFENILEAAIQRFGMRLLAYCVMPNHWHLVLFPRENGDLSRFMAWLTNTHTRRWHTFNRTVGSGHLYQGRYKSFICQSDIHLLAVIRYVERNPRRANLVNRAEDWQWCSAWRKVRNILQKKDILSPWPIPEPIDYFTWLNNPQTQEEEEIINGSIRKNIPFGDSEWTVATINKFGLEQTLHTSGRPKLKNGG